MKMNRIMGLVLLAQVPTLPVLADLKGWPPDVREVRILSAADQSEQPALFFAPKTEKPRPLVIHLHQWSGDYLAGGGIVMARWSVENDWIFAQPNFRGPNKRPEALGSDLVLSDIQGVVDYAKTHAKVDPAKIYLVGASGGGHLALLVAGRMPGVFSAVSAWVPITDLPAWHRQCLGTRYKKYAANIATACGGAPVPGSAAEKEANRRSPLTWLSQASGTVFDLNAGIRNGHNGSVPISHTLRAYNLLARPEDRIAEADIAVMTEKAAIPDALHFGGSDPTYGDNPVLFRAHSPGVRVTVFEGGHQLVPNAALDWLQKVSLASDPSEAVPSIQHGAPDIPSE